MKGFISKGLVGVGSVSGIGCAIGIPLSASSTGRELNVSITPSGGGSESCNLKQQADSSASLVGRNVNFDVLWKKINDTLNQNDECKDLPWKGSLKAILDTASSPSWTVSQEAQENCLKSDFCFYSFQTKSTKGKYKLFIKNPEGVGTWEIIVIKKWQENDPSYYEGYPEQQQVSSPGWRTTKKVDWDQLSSSSAVEWDKIAGKSIKYPNG